MANLSTLSVHHLKKMRAAINKTVAVHQTVLDGQFPSYTRAKYSLYNERCCLCIAFGCAMCPWLLFVGCKCTSYQTEYDYDDDIESIERLNSWNTQIKAELATR